MTIPNSSERRMCYNTHKIRKLVIDMWHLLTLALIIVVGSIAAAFHGDLSGLAGIGKFLGVIAVIIAIAFHPEILILAGIVTAVIILKGIFGDDEPKDDLTIK